MLTDEVIGTITQPQSSVHVYAMSYSAARVVSVCDDESLLNNVFSQHFAWQLLLQLLRCLSLWSKLTEMGMGKSISKSLLYDVFLC